MHLCLLHPGIFLFLFFLKNRLELHRLIRVQNGLLYTSLDFQVLILFSSILFFVLGHEIDYWLFIAVALSFEGVEELIGI